MTAETSNARGEWVLVPRVPTKAMIDAWRDAPDIWGDAYAAMLAAAPQPQSAPVGVEGLIEEWESDLAEDKRDGVSEVAIRVQEIHLDQLRALAQQPAAARVDVRGLVALAEQMERDAAGCRRDGYTDAAAIKEDCAQRIRQTLGISAIAEALAAEDAQGGEVNGELSHTDLCRIFSVFNDHNELHLAQDQRINEWLSKRITESLTGGRNG